MKKKFGKILSILLTVAMMLSLLPATAFALVSAPTITIKDGVASWNAIDGTYYYHWSLDDTIGGRVYSDMERSFNLDKTLARYGKESGTYKFTLEACSADSTAISNTAIKYYDYTTTHTHNWSEEWTTDDTHHWHECLNTGCGIGSTLDYVKAGYGSHSFAGTACTVCGKDTSPAPEPAEELITSANATITKPVAGQNPDKSPKSSDSGKYNVSFYSWYKNESPYTPLKADDVFEVGEEYVLRVVFDAQTGLGYKFDNNTEYTINGDKTSSWGGSNGELRQITYTAEEPVKTISAVSVTVDAPVAGEAASFEPKGLGKGYTAEVEWESEEAELYLGDEFIAGEKYYLWVAFTAEDGYEFADEVTITINGKPAEDTYKNGDVMVGCVTYTLEGDADEGEVLTIKMKTGDHINDYDQLQFDSLGFLLEKGLLIPDMELNGFKNDEGTLLFTMDEETTEIKVVRGLLESDNIIYKLTDEERAATKEGTGKDISEIRLIFVSEEENTHEHQWAEEYNYNSGYHWFECEADGCDVTVNSQKAGYEKHDFSSDRVCADCGYKKPESSSGGGGGGSTKYKVTAEDSENGSVTLSKTNAAKGTTVTVTVDPEAGYEVDQVVVVTKSGKEVKVTDKGDGTFTFDMPAEAVSTEVTYKETVKAEADNNGSIILTIDSMSAWVFGEYVVNDVAPVIRNERTMLPARFVAEALGGVVTWDEANQKVTIVKDEATLEIFIGEPFATVNGNPVALDSPAFIENSRTYLPLRFIAENLGATVTWDGVHQTVTILPGK